MNFKFQNFAIDNEQDKEAFANPSVTLNSEQMTPKNLDDLRQHQLRSK